MPPIPSTSDLCQSGLAHLLSQRLSEAKQDFQKVVAREPANVQSLLALGVIAWQQQCYEAALGYARRLVATDPKPATHHLLLARVLRDSGRLPEAIGCFRAAVRRNATDNQARFELAIVLTDAGILEDAALCYRTALRHDPCFVAAHYNLGNLLLRLNRPAEAIHCYESALALQPDNPSAENNLADAFLRTGRLVDAETRYRSLVERHPDGLDAHYNLGVVLMKRERFSEAAGQFRAVLDRDGHHVDALNNLGTALIESGEYSAAENVLRKAVQQKPESPRPLSNLGVALRGMGRVEEAEACFVQALAIADDKDEARNNLATTLLQTGRLREGWKHYEVRWKIDTLPPRPFKQPRWTGEPLTGKTVLIHAEQGFGDTLQFCRYIRKVAKLARVIFEVQKPLLGLIARSFPEVDCFVARGDPLPAFDCHCPLLSLPLLFDTTLETIPADIPYLIPEPAMVDRWRARLALLPGLRVGLAWRGNQFWADSRLKRDLDPNLLGSLADVRGVSFVSLQKDLSETEQAQVAAILPMTDWTAELNTFDDTAALMAGLDLVFTVDTAMVHLAGAVGRPTWLLNRFDPCWRWLRDREDSPWYPQLRQFRPSTFNGWREVMANAKAALNDYVAR